MQVHGHKAPAFLQVELMHKLNVVYFEKSLSWVIKLKIIDHIISTVAKPLAHTGVHGIRCSARDQKTVRLHLVSRCYSVGILEKKDIFGANN